MNNEGNIKSLNPVKDMQNGIRVLPERNGKLMDNKKSELKKAIIIILFVFVVMNCATASGANVKNVKKYTKQVYYKNDNNEYYKSSLMFDYLLLV